MKLPPGVSSLSDGTPETVAREVAGARKHERLLRKALRRKNRPRGHRAQTIGEESKNATYCWVFAVEALLLWLLFEGRE